MKFFAFISTFLMMGSVQGQYGGLWNGGAFNPWNNPAHPANRGIASGIAARNYFAWPAAPFVRAAPIPSVIANSPALNLGELPAGQQAAIDELRDRKNELDSKIREAAFSGSAIGADFRPGFVNDLLKERMQVVNEIRNTQKELVRDRLALVAKRQEIARQIAESNEPITFGLLMQSLNRAYGQEMAAKSIAHQKKILEKFDRPYLRPVVSVFAPDGLPTGTVAETKIYQNLKEQKGTLLKDEDIFIVTKLSGFTGNKLHLGVDLHGVNETSDDAQALSEDFLETELDFQDEMLESQINLSQKFYELQLENAEEGTELREKIMKKQADRARKILELKNKLAEQKRELDEKLAGKQHDLIEKELERQEKLAEKQRELLEKEIEKQKKQLEKQAELEEKALERQQDLAEKLAEKFPDRLTGKDFVQRQLELNAERVQQQLEFARRQALLHNPFAQQQHVAEGFEFLRNKIQSSPTAEDFFLQKRLERAADLEEKQRELAEKQLEKEKDRLEKEAEKEKDLLEKQQEKEEKLREKELDKEAKAAEKLKDQLEKEKESAEKQLEKEQELVEKQLEKENDLLEKQAEKEEKAKEKQADLLKKQLEKESDKTKKQLEKEAEKAQKQLEKEEEKAKKQLEKEQKLAEKEEELLQKQMEKEAEKAQKQLEKEQELAAKQLEKEQDLAEKQLEKELKQLEKENDLLEKQLEKEKKQEIDSLPIFAA